MRSYKEIARRISKIIVSPESAIGLMHGIISVPTDIGYLAYGFIDTDSYRDRKREKTRMIEAIRFGIFDNHHFTKTIQIVLENFNRHVPEKKQDAIYSKTVASIAGRTLTNSIIAGKLVTAIVQRSSALVSIRGGVIGNSLLAGGMAERSIYTSERLSQNNPTIYNLLRYHNYDLLYFLVEPALNPFC